MQCMVTPTVPHAEEANTISLQGSDPPCLHYDDERGYSCVFPASYQVSSTSSDSKQPVTKMALVMAAKMSLNDPPRIPSTAPCSRPPHRRCSSREQGQGSISLHQPHPLHPR